MYTVRYLRVSIVASSPTAVVSASHGTHDYRRQAAWEQSSESLLLLKCTGSTPCRCERSPPADRGVDQHVIVTIKGRGHATLYSGGCLRHIDTHRTNPILCCIPRNRVSFLITSFEHAKLRQIINYWCFRTTLVLTRSQHEISVYNAMFCYIYLFRYDIDHMVKHDIVSYLKF